jgi:ribosome biogenesis GTPase
MLSNSDPSSQQGIVFKKSQGNYFVRQNGRVVTCAISNRLRKVLIYPIAAPTSLRHRVQDVKDIKSVDPVAVGDAVLFSDGGHDTGVITEVLPRRNQLARRHAGPKPLEQVIVANVDVLAAVMAAAHPAPKWELLDRYLATAELAGIPALICLTKTDLVNEAVFADDLDDYRRLGYRVIATSAKTGAGLDQLQEALTGKLSVFVGKSGVGKTSLLNTLQPGLGLRVNEVSSLTTKGKHTTSHVEMVDLEFGGQVVDTPGMREFGLWQLDTDDLAFGFVEMRPYLGACKFGLDCSHTHEPQCAIKMAVEAGHIRPRRYQSYLRMRED